MSNAERLPVPQGWFGELANSVKHGMGYWRASSGLVWSPERGRGEGGRVSAAIYRYARALYAASTCTTRQGDWGEGCLASPGQLRDLPAHSRNLTTVTRSACAGVGLDALASSGASGRRNRFKSWHGALAVISTGAYVHGGVHRGCEAMFVLSRRARSRFSEQAACSTPAGLSTTTQSVSHTPTPSGTSLSSPEVSAITSP